MSLELVICCAIALVTPQCRTSTEAGYSLDDVEQKIDAHRRMIRMCGPLSVVRACALKGKPVDPEATLTQYRCAQAQGVRVCEVVALCRKLGLKARGIRIEKGSLTCLPTPCIILLNEDRHCVVLESTTARNRSARVWDPSDLTPKTVDVDALGKHWAGHAIVFDRMPATQRLLDTANFGTIILTITLLVRSRRTVRSARNNA